VMKEAKKNKAKQKEKLLGGDISTTMENEK
jgi:hypothetical protein